MKVFPEGGEQGESFVSLCTSPPSNFYAKSELEQIGFRSLGKNVKISKKASIFKPEVITIGDNVRIDDFCILSGGSGIKIGNHVHIGAYSSLFAGSGIIMEDFSNLSVRVSIFSDSDDVSGNSLTGPVIPQTYKPGFIKGMVILKRYSGAAVNSTIMPGVVLEEGAIVGAHSFVNKNCEPWSIYFGVPARKLRRRSKKLISLAEVFLEEYKSG